MCRQDVRSFFCDWSTPGTARGFLTDHLIPVLGYSPQAQDTVADAVLVVSSSPPTPLTPAAPP